MKFKFNLKMSFNKELIPVYLGIFLVSLSIITIEMFLNRMFSLTFWYHFAFLIISIALFGIGFGGMLVYFINPLVKKQVHLTLYILSIGLAAAVIYSIFKANMIPFETNILADPSIEFKFDFVEVYRAALHGTANIVNPKLKQMVNFVYIFLTLSIPFVIGGMIFSIIFTNFSKQIGRVYFADLVGGGLGCFVALWLFPGRGPLAMSVVAAMIILAAAFFFMIFKYKWYFRIPILIIPILLLGYTAKEIYPKMENVKVRVSQSKRDVDTYGPIVYSKWDNFSFVSVHDQKSFFQMFGDFATTTPILKLQGKQPMDLLGSYKNQLYPFFVRKEVDNLCIVGAGGGREIIMALAYKAKNIYALEFNPTFHWLLSDSPQFKEYSGNIAHRPGVNYIKGEGRFFIKSSNRKYDVILFNNAISQTAASSGGYSLSESYLYTAEAFKDYMEHLVPNGILYLSNPFPDAPRFVTTLREAFKLMGKEAEFKKRVIVSWLPKDAYKTCKITVKNGDFTPKELADINNYMRQFEHAHLYVPGLNYGNQVARLVTTTELDKEYFLSDNEIRPATDNWPFFTQRVKVHGQQAKSVGLENVSGFYAQPFLMIKSMMESSAVMCLFFLLLPLVVLNIGELITRLRNLIFKKYRDRKIPKLKNKIGTILYFLALGMGFMLIEVVFMQKFILFLGHPIYSFSVVLATMMITSGIGSLISSKFSAKPFKGIAFAVAGMVIGVLINMIFFQFFSDALISSSFTVRVIISVVLIALCGTFMGFFMPLGIGVVSSQKESAIPWMWSINGTFSVLASFITVYLSVLFGFYFVITVGVLIYILGAAFFILKLKD